ncbi:MAG TPA: hypothetical protein DEP66_05045 [Acidimicrobiaceae bacterium]|nr:hypothetical protein [Acidimicrobiaceae bacterium]
MNVDYGENQHIERFVRRRRYWRCLRYPRRRDRYRIAQTMLSTLRARYGTAGVEWTGDGRLLLTDPNAPPGSDRFPVHPRMFFCGARGTSDAAIRRAVYKAACDCDALVRLQLSGEADEWKSEDFGLTVQRLSDGDSAGTSWAVPLMSLPAPERLGLFFTNVHGGLAVATTQVQLDGWYESYAPLDITETALRNSLNGDYRKLPPFEFECPVTGETIIVETCRGNRDNPFLSGCLADLSGFNTGGAQGILVNVPSTHTLQIAPVGVGHPRIVLGVMSMMRRYAYMRAPGGLFEHSDRPLSEAVLWSRPGHPLACLDADGDGDDSGRPKLEELLTAWGGPYLDEFHAAHDD